MAKRKNIFKIILERLLGFVMFFVMLLVINILTIYIPNPLFLQIVQFINSNIILIIGFSIIFFLGEVLHNLIFPFNLPAPIVNVIGAMYLLNFIYSGFTLVDLSIFELFRSLSFLIYPVVFLSVLVGGYIAIFVRLCSIPKSKPKTKKQKKSPTWDDVEQEIRGFFYDIFSEMRNAVKPKKKK